MILPLSGNPISSGTAIISLNPGAFFTDRKTVFLLASFCCLLWGSAYPAIKNGHALSGIAAG